MRIARPCLACGETALWTLRDGWSHEDDRLDPDHAAVVVPPHQPGCCGRADPYEAFRLRPPADPPTGG